MDMPLTGSVVRLEPLAESHREPLRQAAQDERIWEFNLVSGFGTAFDPWFHAALKGQAAGHRIPFVVVRRTDGAVIGSTSFLDYTPAHLRVEIGSTWYVPGVWSSAVNPECKLLLMTHAFEALRLNRVSFHVDAINVRSQRAVLKLGAVKEGILRKHAVVYTGRIRDTVVFSVTNDDWPAVRERLRERLAGIRG
jgi:RimJ/RimL family protein N-acetyltransferase